MAVRRRLADLVEEGCCGEIKPRGTLPPKTVTQFTRGRNLAALRFAGELEGMIALPVSKIEAGAIERVEPIVVGSDQKGLIYSAQHVWDVPEAPQPLVEACDLAWRLSYPVEKARDIVAADMVVMRIRQEAAGKRALTNMTPPLKRQAMLSVGATHAKSGWPRRARPSRTRSCIWRSLGAAISTASSSASLLGSANRTSS